MHAPCAVKSAPSGLDQLPFRFFPCAERVAISWTRAARVFSVLASLIQRKTNRLLESLIDSKNANAPSCDQLSGSCFIGPGPMLGLSRGDELHRPVFVEFSSNAVNPPRALR